MHIFERFLENYIHKIKNYIEIYDFNKNFILLTLSSISKIENTSIKSHYIKSQGLHVFVIISRYSYVL